MAIRAQHGMSERTDIYLIDDVRRKLIENRDKHIAEYNDAVEDFKKLKIAYYIKERKNINELLKTLEENPFATQPDTGSFPLKPESYADSYDDMIAILNAIDPAQKTITLTSTEFRCYYLDKWDWKTSFNTSYASNKAAIGSVR